jgi:lysophospholipase L1-like esterase
MAGRGSLIKFRASMGVALIAAALTLAQTAYAQTPPVASMPDACRVPSSVFVADAKLVHSSKRVVLEKRLSIVAIGSSSTMGMGATSAEAAWPARLEADLRRRLPNVAVTVQNRAKPRETADQMAKRMAKDVLSLKPDLVLWETGTADAVRSIDLDQFGTTLEDGIAAIVAAKADTMLVSPQYARDTVRLIGFQPYIDAMNQAGLRHDVAIFPRYETMRHWIESGQMKLENVPRDEMTKVADMLYDCLGRQIARVVLRAMNLPKDFLSTPTR